MDIRKTPQSDPGGGKPAGGAPQPPSIADQRMNSRGSFGV